MTDESSLTARLHMFMQGDKSVVDKLLSEILPKLHEIALRELKRERYAPPVSKTELIHEVWLRSLSKGGWQVKDRGHFYALASLAVRRVLVEMARNRLSQKRGSGEAPISMEVYGEVLTTSTNDARQIVEIGLLMEKLETQDPTAAIVVDMHYFAGFTLEEIARNTGLTFRQARACWERGRDSLKKLMSSTAKGAASAS